MINEFKNLFEFFSDTEFCPLCDKRLSISAALPYATSSEITGHKLIVSTVGGHELLNVALVDNFFVHSDPFPSYGNIFTDNIELQLIQQCKKYHYQHVGSAYLNFKTKRVVYICSNKKHIHERVDNNHFSISVQYEPKNQTSIKLTSSGSKTREIILNNADFDFSSKKKIISKLRTIQLLG